MLGLSFPFILWHWLNKYQLCSGVHVINFLLPSKLMAFSYKLEYLCVKYMSKYIPEICIFASISCTSNQYKSTDTLIYQIHLHALNLSIFPTFTSAIEKFIKIASIKFAISIHKTQITLKFQYFFLKKLEVVSLYHFCFTFELCQAIWDKYWPI